MTLGQKIKKLRIEKELTQKDLADQLHVTFQTVSKWEGDTNEPDIATLKELAKLFDCSIDHLLSDDVEEPVKEEEKPVETVINKTIIIHEKPKHTCKKCGEEIPDDELEIYNAPHSHGVGKMHHMVYTQEFYHKHCLEEKLKAEEDAKTKFTKQRRHKNKTKCLVWSIIGGVLGLGGLLAILLAGNAIHPALSVLISIIFGYLMFSLIFCIMVGSYVSEVFVSVASWSIRFPGIIFSFDLDGFAFLIAMKILFAVLGFLIGLATLSLAVAIAGLCAMFTFPFVLVDPTNFD